ncbi:MAG: hypothetical protein LiPW39_452 [Parcubacteria group bacterium LiPW_39]|nr:MAG: hypothetical protein LiPW39_452 [Parcubacteria group bacterium LiPW_39]
MDRFLDVVICTSTIILGIWITRETHFVIALWLAPMIGFFIGGVVAVVVGAVLHIIDSASYHLNHHDTNW